MMKKNVHKGFSLIEMLVAVAIFAVISSILLANYPEFRSRAALDNTAHEIALVFREAQVYGISVRGQSGESFPVYGVYVGDSSSKALNQLVIFGDKNNNGLYDGEKEGNETLDTFTFTGGEKITQVCINDTTFSSTEMTCNERPRIEPFSVLFKRPDPDAIFVEYKGDPAEVIAGASSVAFEISNRSGSYRRAVQVTSTGQIVVK